MQRARSVGVRGTARPPQGRQTAPVEWLAGMLTVADLANELRCTVNEIQRAGRDLGIAAKSPGYRLSLEDFRLLKEKVLQAQSEAAEASRPRVAEPADESPVLDDRFVPVRDLVGHVRGATAVRLRLHEDFAQWLWGEHTEPRLKRRANLVLRQLAAFGRTSIVKSVRGAGRGWRRSPLGGNQGRQFYLWWVPAGAPPIADVDLPKDHVLIRAVRHHDETSSALDAGNVATDYIDLTADELVNQRTEYGFAFNDAQLAITRSPNAVRFIKGHPGAGKTTALWLAASVTEGRQALYLTFNTKLALEAEQYFRALGPETLGIEVLTFEQLINRLLDSGDSRGISTLDPDEAVEEFSEVIAGNYRGVLGPWEKRLEELYAELHAHAIGEAIPIDLRGVAASDGPVMDKIEYIAARTTTLGTHAARTAGQIANHLADGKLIEQLFPGPARARRALDRLLADPSIAQRFNLVDVVLVDETQDLTRVELLLLVKLCATIGQSRDAGPPAFIAAGDEAQTVRPSDFEWGQLADLTATLIGRRSEFELPGNVRSPRNIALVVNQSWDLYRQLAKDERPRGYAEAEIEDASPGRVIYTACAGNEELRELIRAFETIPNAAFVYPGYTIPERYKELLPATADVVLTSQSAKGLDFQTVAVLDVGRQLSRLRELAQEAQTEGRFAALWGRTLADHVRVALSRATETLILIDVDADQSSRDQVLELCAAAELSELSAEELVTMLRSDENDPAQLALEFCEEVEKLLGTQPMRAYRRAKQAVALLGDPKSDDSVQDAALRRQAWLLRAVAAVDLVRNFKQLRPKPAQSPDELLDDAVTSLRRGERGQDAQALLLIHRIAAAPPSTIVTGEAAELSSLLAGLEMHVERYARDTLVAWCRDLSGAPIPVGAANQRTLVDTVTQLVESVGSRHPDLRQYRERLLLAVASSSMGEGRYADALGLLKSALNRDNAMEAVCHEQLGNHSSAARAFELAGDTGGALRNLRRVPDVQGALRLAQRLNHEDLPAIQWLSKYSDLMASLSPHVAARLTDAERRLVAASRDDALLDSGVEQKHNDDDGS